LKIYGNVSKILSYSKIKLIYLHRHDFYSRYGYMVQRIMHFLFPSFFTIKDATLAFEFLSKHVQRVNLHKQEYAVRITYIFFPKKRF
jgi:hypothetical protein